MTFKTYIAALLPALLFAQSIAAQAKKYDSLAIIIIDRMSDMISGMESCSFRLNVANDVRDPSRGLIKQISDFEVYMSGPDKMLINTHGVKGHRRFVYNGRELALFSFDHNYYGVLPAPSTTIGMIDSMHKEYDFEFPAADFFYPAFTDDLLQNSDSLVYLGKIAVNEKEYFQIMAYSKTANYQFWINNDPYSLPAKFSITYKNMEGNPQYMASFSDWNPNPKLPDTMFDFLPPPGARRIRIMSKTDR